MINLLIALSYSVGVSSMCSVFQQKSQHQINAYNSITNRQYFFIVRHALGAQGGGIPPTVHQSSSVNTPTKYTVI